jgi:hypothetical protein
VCRLTYLVAITNLATTVDEEARALVSELGGVAYDQRLKLAAGVPAIVLQTPDPHAAKACALRLLGRGHSVVACAADDVVASSVMIAPRELELGHDGLVAGRDQLAWSSITWILRATHRITTQTKSTTTERKFDAVRAAVSGGLIVRKTETTTRTSHATDNEQVLYLFGGPTPWIVREQHVRYELALGAAVTTHSLKNFELTLVELRKHAPHAQFDDRLVSRKGSPEDIDVLAHFIAR